MAGLGQITYIVRERQLRLRWHVARLPAEDRAHRIRSWRDTRGWTIPSGRPHSSCLRQVESYLKDTGMAGLVSALPMARRRPRDYRRKVDAATSCSGVWPHTCPNLIVRWNDIASNTQKTFSTCSSDKVSKFCVLAVWNFSRSSRIWHACGPGMYVDPKKLDCSVNSSQVKIPKKNSRSVLVFK